MRSWASLVTQKVFLGYARTGSLGASARWLEGTSQDPLSPFTAGACVARFPGRQVGSEKIGDLHVNLHVKSAISPEARYLDLLAKATLSKRDLACGEL